MPSSHEKKRAVPLSHGKYGNSLKKRKFAAANEIRRKEIFRRNMPRHPRTFPTDANASVNDIIYSIKGLRHQKESSLVVFIRCISVEIGRFGTVNSNRVSQKYHSSQGLTRF